MATRRTRKRQLQEDTSAEGSANPHNEKVPALVPFMSHECDDLPNSQEVSVVQLSQNSSGRTLDIEEVGEIFEDKGLSDVAKIFKEENIDGSILDMLTEERLQTMGVQTMGTRLKVLKLLEDIQSNISVSADQIKIFNDPIHGHLELHPLCVRIIDTPQFQRLRFLKQLGGCYFVYPGAAHNRFEHCLGVCHLAGQLGRALQRRQPELKITEKDILCVEIAGLCHDLGHGPFSHMFDGKFIPFIRPDSKWKHEEASVKMFDYLVEDNDLVEVFKQYGMSEIDRTFIKEQIAGPKPKDELHPQKNGTHMTWPYQGRPKEKSFLYEIVANKRNGIDVDKWDYFARDCHMLGIRNNFDHTRFMKFARVLEIDNELQICSRDKEVGNLYDMFHTRMTLHRRAYQHKVNNIIETMITEAFIKANDYVLIPGKGGKLLKMSETIDDMEAYTKLNDGIFHQILLSTDRNLEESKQILYSILRRQLYKCVGQAKPIEGKTFSKADTDAIKREILQCGDDEQKLLGLDDLVVHVVFLDYGMKDKNPIDKVRFYNKKDPTKAIRVRKNEVSQMLPEKFAEQIVRLYCKKRDHQPSLDYAARCFQLWCEKKGFPSPKAGDNECELTPVKMDGTNQKTPDQKINGESPKSPSSAGKFRQRLSFD